MRPILRRFLTPLALVLGCFCSSASTGAALWNTAYYAGWMQSYLPASQVDFSALTHIQHFSLVPKSDGTLDSSINGVTSANSADLVSRAHAAGVKAIISIGGWDSATGFRGATTSANLSRFVNNLVGFMQTRGYDGLDLDWEPLDSGDAAQFTSLVNSLRSALDALAPRPLLTAATATQPALFATLQSKFDQINLMTYDLAGPWPGWVTWFNAPVYDGGYRFASTGGLVPSADGLVKTFAGAGVALAKLGIGIDFYGYVWSGGAGTTTGGVSLPRQSWTTAPTMNTAAYYTIMTSYYQPQLAFWDTAAQSAFLSIDNTGSASDKFISYDNEQTCRAKVEYARAKGIGGVMIWELGGGYRADQVAGARDPLLQAVKAALSNTSADTTPPTVSVTAPAAGATVSGLVGLAATAADNVGVAGLQWQIDGVNLGAEVAPPYSTSWNSANSPNGSHTVTAVARDAAGNTAAAFASVTVNNSAPVADLWVYREALLSPWINASWSATVNFNYNKKPYVGNRSIQVVQQAWGALSVHSGSWSSSVALTPSSYSSVSFAIHGGTAGVHLGVQLENDAAAVFPRIDYGTIPANTWVTVSVPMAQLNPNGRVFHRLDIEDLSGLKRTYYVDEIRLVHQ